MYFISHGGGGRRDFCLQRLFRILGGCLKNVWRLLRVLRNLGKKTVGVTNVSGSNGAGEKAGRKLFAAAVGKSVPYVKKTVDSQTNQH